MGAPRCRCPSHPLFAALYRPLTRPAERLLRPLRRRLLAGCSGDVLEVGVGTGANFPLWRELAGVRLWAVEPDPHMLGRARREAERLGLAVELRQARAEELPFPDGSFDCVVACLVLCSVSDPDLSLREIARVLRPGGELRFLEHVRAAGAAGRWQDRLRPIWAPLAGGCQLNRRTGELLWRAGFAPVSWEAIRVAFPACVLLLGRAAPPGT